MMLYWGIQFAGQRVIGLKENLQDQIILFRGMFGVPPHLIWYIAPDRNLDNIQGNDIFDFFIFDEVKTNPRTLQNEWPEPRYQDVFKILNIVFDIEKQLFKLTAVSKFWFSLATNTKIESMRVGTQEKPVSGKHIIKKLIDISTTDHYYRAELHASAVDRVKYVSVNMDAEDSALDKISDICLENGWEWLLGKGKVEEKRQDVLYVKNKLVLNNVKALPHNPEEEHRVFFETLFYITITTAAVWCEPGMVYGKPAKGRVIWTKHFLNNEGNEMTIMIQKTHSMKGGPLVEDAFIQTLYGGFAREYGLQRYGKYPKRSFPLLIGKTYGELESKNKEEYSMPKWSGDPKTADKDLNKRSFQEEFTGEDVPQHYLTDRKMTTPFAGDGVGLLFPQVEGHKTLLAPDGERDIGLLGPGYFGPGEQVPVRLSDQDFRLQLPGNAMLYYDSSAKQWIMSAERINLTIGISPPDDYEGVNEASVQIADGTVSIYGNGTTYTINVAQGEISMGPRVIIDGDLQVKGNVQAADFKTVIIPSVNAKLPTKVPPG